MAKSTHAESRHLYSWWWDSHISPKNSKWLKENLTDMDIKVKTMIRLLEQDADSFARRAEMYYKKRPELLTLVEEFYRAYRALAERYDHANGALRQAQRTIVEVFPNQIPFVLADEPPYGSSATEAASHTPEMPPRIRAMLDSDDSHKDALRVPSQFHDIKKNGSYSEENYALTGKKGLNFQDEGKNSECKVLQEEVSQLSKENQNLKSQITSESARADNIDAEVRSLQEIISKLKSEKDAALLQHQLSQERISNLETEISCCQEALKKLEDEMLIVASKLRSAEERCLLLDKANQSLHLELDSLKQRAKDQQEELNRKQEELEKLNISIQDRHLQHAQAEMARLSSEKLQSQSQEEASLLALEVQSGIKKLKGMELDKLVLEEEIQKLKEENGSLNEQILASAYKIIDLQDEIIFLKDLIAKLEEKAGLHLEEKNVLLKEISCLKEDRNNLEQRHNRLTEQIEEVNFNVESLQTMVKELQNGNAELKEICKKYEDEKVVHLENLKHIEKISEKNVVLEISLSDANVEIEGSREKIKTLEESCESLSGMISKHISEKAVLVSKLESIAQEMEKLSERNTFLENSLSDVSLEVEGLRVKSEVLEESCRSLCAQNSSLISEKTTLVYQVERTIQSLENLETCYDELESKHSNLEMEKDLPLHRIVELQESFKREKEEYETLIMSIFLSSKSQLTTLENEICLLQEESRLREEEFEVEQHKIIDAQIENFILQRSLIDMNENNSILSELCQKNLEASECAEKLISELKQELVVQEKKLTSSSVRNEKLREGIQLMLRELCVNKECGSLDGIEDEVLLKLTLHEIRGLLNSISDIQNENQFLLLEKSVNITILNQFGRNVMNLITEKSVLEQDSEVKLKELSVLQSKELELLEMNEQLRQDVQASNQRQESLETEMEVLRTQVIDLREAHGTLQSENCNLLEENQSLSKKFYDVGEKRDTLEEENSVILAEVMTMEYLYLIFMSSSAEKESELQLLRSDLARLHGVKNDLDQEIRLMNEKLVAVETENVHLKETIVDLEESKRRLMIVEDDLNTTRDGCKQLNLDIELGKDLLAQKDIELLQANHQFLSIQDKNTELCRDLEGLQLDINRVREDLENKIFRLSEDNAERDNEILHLRQELDKLHTKVEGLITKEEHLNYALRKGVDEVESCEVEIASLLDDIHITAINAAVFEEKAIELLIASDISAVVQRETLHEEMTLKNANVDELKEKLASLEREDRGLKEEMNAYLLLAAALWDDISSLEEHTLLLANHRASNRRENKENLSQDIQHSKGSQKPSEYQSATVPTGLLELQKLRAKVKALQKVVIDTESLLEQEMFESNASLVAAMKEIEVLKSEVQISKDIVMQLEKSEEPDPDLKLQESDVGSSKVKHEQMMKDIQLDHVLSSSQYGYDVASYGSNSMDKDGNNDQMLESWETTERDCDDPTQRASSVTSVHEIECLPIEVVEEEKSEYLSSELVSQKELSFDKLELPNKVKVRHQDTNINAIERLSSDAQRLSFLKTSVQKLKKNLEISEMSDCCTSSEFDKVKSQVKEAEEAISRLIDTNRKLTKKAEKISPSSGSLAAEQDEKRSTSRRKILEHARRGSEKIGRLELELQKIQYILLKLKEENEKKGADRRRVLLKDYLYGRYDARRKKKGSSCGCMRPKTKDD